MKNKVFFICGTPTTVKFGMSGKYVANVNVTTYYFKKVSASDSFSWRGPTYMFEIEGVSFSPIIVRASDEFAINGTYITRSD